MTERKPQVGEVWGTGDGGWTCIDDVADRCDQYGWLRPGGTKLYSTTKGMTPPLPQPPEWLADRWANVYPGTTSVVSHSAEYADTAAGARRIGRVSLTGQWVPCDGKRVLA